jgi:hypothetical protein
MNLPDGVPTAKGKLITDLVSQLSNVEGVAAIVLGGSYARGAQHKDSDLDLGIYYSDSQPFSIGEVRRIAQEVSVGGDPVVTGFGDWGAWVNGGAWIHTACGKVDFLYRSLEKVEQTITDARDGIFNLDFNQQPPYGFYSVIYLAETHICVPLFDPNEHISHLKNRIQFYPGGLKNRIIRDSLWLAEFTLVHARNFAAKGDVYNTVGCLTRTAANLTQSLFALNEVYFINDKTAMAEISGFRLVPNGYTTQLTGILSRAGSTKEELTESVEHLSALWTAVVSLAGEGYSPAFRV